jgi:hypothetical protein
MPNKISKGILKRIPNKMPKNILNKKSNNI